MARNWLQIESRLMVLPRGLFVFPSLYFSLEEQASLV